MKRRGKKPTLNYKSVDDYVAVPMDQAALWDHARGSGEKFWIRAKRIR